VPATYVEKIKVQRAKGRTQSIFRFDESKKKKKQWQECKTDDGQTYYYNEETQESRWDPPEEKEPEPEKKAFVPAPEKTCAQAGCSNKPFAGKPYCVSHMKGEGKAAGGGGGGGGARPVQATQAAAVRSQPAQPKFQPIPGGGRGRGGAGAGGGSSVGPSIKPTMQPIPGRAAGGGSTAGGGGGSSTGAGGGGGGARPGFGNIAIPMGVPGAKKATPAKKKSEWIKVNDASSGQDYFYNEVTGESSWDKPPGFY